MEWFDWKKRRMAGSIEFAAPIHNAPWWVMSFGPILPFHQTPSISLISFIKGGLVFSLWLVAVVEEKWAKRTEWSQQSWWSEVSLRQRGASAHNPPIKELNSALSAGKEKQFQSIQPILSFWIGELMDCCLSFPLRLAAACRPWCPVHQFPSIRFVFWLKREEN